VVRGEIASVAYAGFYLPPDRCELVTTVAHRRRRGPGVLAVVVVAALLAAAFGSIPPARPAPGPGSTVRVALGNLAPTPRVGGTGSSEAGAAVSPAVAPTVPAYSWSNASLYVGPQIPNERAASGMAWDPSVGKSILYGGFIGTGPFAGTDTWTYVNGTWTNITSSVVGTPPPVYLTAFAFDPSTGSIVMFGGTMNGAIWTNWTWLFHSDTWTNVTTTAGPAPPVMEYPSMATDTEVGDVVLVGNPGSGPLQTWTFDHGLWTNVSTPVPLGVIYAPPHVSSDPADGGVVLVTVAENGSTGADHSSTFAYAAGTWTNLTASNLDGPLPVTNFAVMEYLTPLSAVVLSDAAWYSTSALMLAYTATWEFAGGVWKNLTSSVGPYPSGNLIAPAATAAPYDGALVEFGGENVHSYVNGNATWVFSGPPVVAAALAPTQGDVGTSFAVTGSATFGAGPNVPSLSWGDGTTAASYSGSHAYASAGAYAVTLSVTDLVGQTSTSAVALIVNPDPTASIVVSPTSPTAGSAAGLIATVTGGTAPFTYAWTLGDGSSATTVSVTHTYASAGSYSVALTVTDADGQTAKATGTVVVVAASSSPINLTSGLGLALLLLVILLAIVAVVLGVLLARRRSPPRSPPSAYPAPPTSSPGPPPGGGGSSPP
jgi:PKD repeat protein